MAPPKILTHRILSFCAFRSDVPNKTTVARLKSNILAPKKFGLATPLVPDYAIAKSC